MSDTSRPFFQTWLIRLGLFMLTIVAASPLIVGLARPLERADGTISLQPSSHDIDDSTESPPPHYVVEVTGREFRWQFQVVFPAEFVGGSRPNSVLRIPAGASVDWELSSDDYVYMFSVPNLGIRQVAVPGLTETWQTGPLASATYDLLVDPICGFRFWHDELMGRVIIEAQPPTRPSEAK
ncbi:MAG: hypothetical protein ABGX22_27345 [Pirellulaceae bacterium]|nr:hypothetical protein [Planctomycetaceae bacterium]